jgi:hypothetical protein
VAWLIGPQLAGGLFALPIEAWQGYLYSLWAQTFMALFAALFFLVALRLGVLTDACSGREPSRLRRER